MIQTDTADSNDSKLLVHYEVKSPALCQTSAHTSLITPFAHLGIWGQWSQPGQDINVSAFHLRRRQDEAYPADVCPTGRRLCCPGADCTGCIWQLDPVDYQRNGNIQQGGWEENRKHREQGKTERGQVYGGGCEPEDNSEKKGNKGKKRDIITTKKNKIEKKHMIKPKHDKLKATNGNKTLEQEVWAYLIPTPMYLSDSCVTKGNITCAGFVAHHLIGSKKRQSR